MSPVDWVADGRRAEARACLTVAAAERAHVSPARSQSAQPGSVLDTEQSLQRWLAQIDVDEQDAFAIRGGKRQCEIRRGQRLALAWCGAGDHQRRERPRLA